MRCNSLGQMSVLISGSVKCMFCGHKCTETEQIFTSECNGWREKDAVVSQTKEWITCWFI